jgi:hypothetical protein
MKKGSASGSGQRLSLSLVGSAAMGMTSSNSNLATSTSSAGRAVAAAPLPPRTGPRVPLSQSASVVPLRGAPLTVTPPAAALSVSASATSGAAGTGLVAISPTVALARLALRDEAEAAEPAAAAMCSASGRSPSPWVLAAGATLTPEEQDMAEVAAGGVSARAPIADASTRKPTRMQRAKTWNMEVENHFRLMETGWQSLEHYHENYPPPTECWPNGLLRTLRVRTSGYYTCAFGCVVFGLV